MTEQLVTQKSSYQPDLAVFDSMIRARRKMTSRLYQVILSGRASQRLLQQFVVHRFPIKNFWSRNILGIASRIEDYGLRCELIENIYEEETGRLSGSQRHLETFIAFGEALGLNRAEITDGEVIPETRAVIEHNIRSCNNTRVHLAEGVASVLLLMEGQPPIVAGSGSSMEAVMRDVYRLPPRGYEFFTHHASSTENSASRLEGDHASTARRILTRYCSTPEIFERARSALERAIELRHEHFDAIHSRYHDEGAEPFRFRSS